MQWLKVWEWGKTGAETPSDSVLPKAETDAEIPALTSLPGSGVTIHEQDPSAPVG